MSPVLNQSTVFAHGDGASPFQHGIPGILTDGKVVQLKNSKLKSKVHLFQTRDKKESKLSSIFNGFRLFFPNLGATSSVHDDDDDTKLYQHGIPGIPTDGKVALLKNSKLKSLVYLIGTVHISKQSAETVKKVINYVKPDVVAVELCRERAVGIMTTSLKDDVTLLDMLYGSMMVPWGLSMKIAIFALGCWDRQLRAKGILQGLEFKVAIQESSRVGARCVLIDQDWNVTYNKVSKVFSWGLLWNSLLADYKDIEYTRSSVKEMTSLSTKHYPEFEKVLVDDRDKFMFEGIRSFEKKVVAVVGMAHMDGIELLWKQAEEAENKKPSIMKNCMGCFTSYNLYFLLCFSSYNLYFLLCFSSYNLLTGQYRIGWLG
ncbi:hypothetical protein MKW94_023742 [Papaver nudicaule]|uniref:TraB family protein n=1 Tax=Papaver nudicaule TaxID=74823 RepID=A0AA41RYM6_PAPNU|nr:hypothetical protein [Papaver nudicaule]MCL7051296.1 hypothetical protein [Papaver nudicaule]